MGPLVFLFIVYLYGAALVTAVPVATTAPSPQQVVHNPTSPGLIPPNATPDPTQEITPRSVGMVTIPQLSTRLGLPTGPSTFTETSTTTSIVPSSTTTRTFKEQSIVATTTSTFVINETVETTLNPQTIASPPPTPSAAQAKENGAVSSVIWDGGTAMRLSWTPILGLFLVINPW